MKKSIAIYPHHISDKYIKKVHNAIDLAVKYNFNEVFTSVHLPEYPLDEQLETLRLISSYAKKNNLEVTVDMGGHFIKEILEDKKYLGLIKTFNFDYIRLDYGYNFKQVKSLYSDLNIRGFVINASIYTKKEVDRVIKQLNKIDKKLEIRACHNYYVRGESGLDGVFSLRQDSYFHRYNIPIYYCIPTHSNPRGPLYGGLCTIEKHRNKSISEIMSDLVLNYNLNAFMMSDEWLSEDEFKEVDKTLALLKQPLKREETIEVRFLSSATAQEKGIVLQKHLFRHDSPYNFLRSQSSRQMAEFANKIKKNKSGKRKAGYITIDNELYKRYSGELQIVTRDYDVDEKVNVVAKIANEDDLIKLRRFREGITYNFVEIKK